VGQYPPVGGGGGRLPRGVREMVGEKKNIQDHGPVAGAIRRPMGLRGGRPSILRFGEIRASPATSGDARARLHPDHSSLFEPPRRSGGWERRGVRGGATETLSAINCANPRPAGGHAYPRRSESQSS